MCHSDIAQYRNSSLLTAHAGLSMDGWERQDTMAQGYAPRRGVHDYMESIRRTVGLAVIFLLGKAFICVWLLTQ